MKRSGIKKPSYEEALAKKRAKYKKPDYALRYEKARLKMIASKRTPSRTRKKAPRTRAKLTHKGYRPPAWFTSIKAKGGHGSNQAQKNYWRLTSIAVRVEDFEKYEGACVSCGIRLGSWKEGQAAHFRAWTLCNAFFKYERKNLALSCYHCNHINDGPIGSRFGREMERRYGEGFVDWVLEENKKHKGQKMEIWEIVARTQPLYEKYKQYL